MIRSVKRTDALADFLPQEGPYGVWVICARFFHSKTNQFGKEETLGLMRFVFLTFYYLFIYLKNIDIKTLKSVELEVYLYIFYRFNFNKEQWPDFSDRSQW